MGYIDRLKDVADNDVKELVKKDAEYGGSWKQEGGVGAFMMLARKFHRMQNALRPKDDVAHLANGFSAELPVAPYDIFSAITTDRRPEGILDDIRDLRRYLMLVEAEMVDRGVVSCSPVQTKIKSLKAPELDARGFSAKDEFGYDPEDDPEDDATVASASDLTLRASVVKLGESTEFPVVMDNTDFKTLSGPHNQSVRTCYVPHGANKFKLMPVVYCGSSDALNRSILNSHYTVVTLASGYLSYILTDNAVAEARDLGVRYFPRLTRELNFHDYASLSDTERKFYRRIDDGPKNGRYTPVDGLPSWIIKED